MTPPWESSNFNALTQSSVVGSCPDLFSAWNSSPVAEGIQKRLETDGLLRLIDVTPGSGPFLVACLRRLQPQRTIVVVCDNLKSQESFHQDLSTWLAVPSTPKPSPLIALPLFYPAWDVLPRDSRLPHVDVISERLETLIPLTRPPGTEHFAPTIVTSARALLQKTFAPADLAHRIRRLRKGEVLNPLDLIEWLEEQGYEPESQVTGKGEISWRGGIVDVFPPSRPWPVRFEFFGNELESLREFDPHNQLSRCELEEVAVSPAGELGILRQAYRSREADASSSTPAPPLASILEYLPSGTMLVMADLEAIEQEGLQQDKEIPADDPFFLRWDELRALMASRDIARIDFTEGYSVDPPVELESPPQGSPVTDEGKDVRERGPIRPGFTPLDLYRLSDQLSDLAVVEKQRRDFFSQLHRWLRQGYLLHVFCNNEGEQQRFEEIWREYKLGSSPPVLRGALSRGFVHHLAQIAVVTDAEIFGRYKIQRPRRLKSAHAAAVRSAFEVDFSDFDEGDYVVHVDHGIGRFRGLQSLPVARGSARGTITPPSESTNEVGEECLVIEFASSTPDSDPPRLYVPIREAHLVSKYVGAGKARPQLSTLGGNRWSKAKHHAERAVRDLAAELLSIQATRSTQPGHQYPADLPWQREFEGSFLYEETPDQLKAIEAVKKDMESPKPMDRLLCGDVGFGKTEVALRAAFKAVLSGKQVALLVPTTVLAQQHFNNFRERMADYPIRLELLSRFRSHRQQRAALEAAADGSVDILIGTHRLVQRDVQFRDLGLVIVDEEQRFGVKHKEALKRLRQTVDILTLSATPIPRTLYLALTGARDLSTLETPPQDRLPIETVVAPHDERLIRDAIVRELGRGGQVYYLHNRVATIDAVALRVQTLVPDARVVVGHGQMDSDNLERAMTRFVNAEADVLVSTTIIESGLDIPNANTIIIDRADRFGLSELYQLRGRVGRYRHQAFAYLLLPRHAQLLTEARKRMSAIRQYSALGSGFKIAMRDLEIRGAGNLLGPEQSGHITAVGFDLYCRLLKQSVQALKGESVQKRVEVDLRLDFIALNPAEETHGIVPPIAPVRRARKPHVRINIPRDTDVTVTSDEFDEETPGTNNKGLRQRAPAYLPLEYIREPHLRLEIYRRLAQVSDKASLDDLRNELQDRFGAIPEAVNRRLELTSLKLLAAERGVNSIEVKDGKIRMFQRQELIMPGRELPRLKSNDSDARLGELRRLILSLPVR